MFQQKFHLSVMSAKRKTSYLCQIQTKIDL